MTEDLKDVYIGEVRNQVKNGYGVYKFKNGFYRYEGDWKNGKKHGHGKLVMADGSFYQGDFLNGEITGSGFKWSAGQDSKYSGEFLNGEYHGNGIIDYGNGCRYEGGWQRNQFHGRGVLLLPNGDVYDGEFHCHRRHGAGSMKYKNGDSYDGDWIRGKRQGHGRLLQGDGSDYEGQFFNDHFHGQGRMRHSSGIVYDGLWGAGEPVSRAARIIVANHLDGIINVAQGDNFELEVEVLSEEGQVLHVESGRKLKVTAGFQNFKPANGSSIFHQIEDYEERAIDTPFGYEAVEFPLADASAYAAFLERQAAEPQRTQSAGAPGGDRRPEESATQLLDSGAEIGADSTANFATEQPAAAEQHVQDTGEFRLASPQPPSLSPEETLEGRATFSGLLLPRPHSLFRPYAAIDERDGAASPKMAAAAAAAAGRKKKGRDREDADAKSRSKRLGDERFARPGEYVVRIDDASVPAFTQPPPQPAFVRVALTALPTLREAREPKEKEKKKQWDTSRLIATSMVK